IIKEFYNPSDEPKQGQIAFPLEKGHELITDLRMKIGNVTYGSSTQNRTDALNAFLEAIAKGQDAALVQYDPPRDVYWIAVTIPPKEARTTITTLEMPLTKTDGFYEYTYRLSIDARDSVSYLRVHAHVETAAPLVEVQVPSHPSLPVVRGGLHFADAYINETRPAATGDLHIRFRAAGISLSQFADPGGDRYVRFSLDAADARRAGQQPLLILVSDGRPTRAPFDPDLEPAYARISYEQEMPVFAMAVRPADHDDETVLHNLSAYHGGQFVALFGDVSSSVAELLASFRVPVLQGVQAEIPDSVNLTFASANPQVVWQGGEAFVIARMRGTTNDSLDLRVTWSDPAGSSPPSSGGSFLFVPALVAEARKADALRRDAGNLLVVQDEVDRYVTVGSPEYATLDLSTATSRYEGSYLRILDVGGELVGVRRGLSDTSQLVANGIGFTCIAFAVIALVRLSRRGAL